VAIMLAVITLSLSPFIINDYISRSEPGIVSNIKYLFVVELSHLDIGFTDPPDEVAEFYKQIIDQAVENCKSDPDYVWTIEEIWQLEQWMARSNSTEIEELMNLTQQGRIGLTAGYATMHSGVMGHEEVNRFLYPGVKIAGDWNVSIETLIQNDVPGYSWAYPQMLNKSGVKFMVTGINTWLDMGKPNIPMSDMPFYWEGPDGSKVLTWISFDAYIEGITTYGLTDLQTAYNSLTVKLPELESHGYMYDAVLVLRATGDNRNTDLAMTALARQWNSTYDNPKMVLAHPSDFFNYIISKYGKSFPTYRGDWTSWWDILGMTQPQGVKKNRWVHDNILTVEKLSTINELLGLSGYPLADVQLAYQNAMEFDEHMTGGAPWPGLMTAAETRRQNEILYGYAASAYNKTYELLNNALDTFFESIASNNTMIIVFNPLSWNRTDLVRINVSDTLFSQAFQLIDSDTGLPVEYQKLTNPTDITGREDVPDGKTDMRDIGLVARYFGENVPPAPQRCDLTGPTPGVPDGTIDMRDVGLIARYFGEVVPYKQMIFVAQDVPQLGYKKYEVINASPSAGSSTVNISGNIIENAFYEITLNASDGHIISVYDKEQTKELVNRNSEFDFNGAIKSTKDQSWLGEYSEVPIGSVEIDIGLNGPVAKSLIIRRSNSPFVETEITLYDNLKRVDLVNTMNRTLMDWVPIDVGYVFYAYNFPFNLTGFDVKLEISNGFMTPLSDQLPGANTAYFTTQHGLELYETSYGVTWASKETFTHEFEGINLYSTTFSPTEATLTSRFLKKEDEGQFRDWQGSGFTGPIVPEPGASPLLIHSYSFTTYEGSFDPVNTSRFLWSHSNPFLAGEALSNPIGLLENSSLSFLNINSSNVILLDIKKADFGSEYIVRLLEVEGSETVFTLSSQYFTIDQATITSNVEEDIIMLTVQDGKVITSISPFETLTIRLTLTSP
jgi:hypothetical protein